ncbi:MAG: 50S ribosomal protein L15 [Chloroflexi bacterium]|nr:50S ribosomal protein L15 [Chloroflexota bacterium]
MQLHDLRSPAGARRPRRRVGRGHGSGLVKTAGRGQKGQKSRSGGGVRPGFEGGQLPLVQRLPYKRGFTNIFRTAYEVVNVGDLAKRFEPGTVVTLALLRSVRLVRTNAPVKILAQGELDRALTVQANAFSAAAKEKITAAGGQVEEI